MESVTVEDQAVSEQICWPIGISDELKEDIKTRLEKGTPSDNIVLDIISQEFEKMLPPGEGLVADTLIGYNYVIERFRNAVDPKFNPNGRYGEDELSRIVRETELLSQHTKAWPEYLETNLNTKFDSGRITLDQLGGGFKAIDRLKALRLFCSSQISAQPTTAKSVAR